MGEPEARIDMPQKKVETTRKKADECTGKISPLLRLGLLLFCLSKIPVSEVCFYSRLCPWKSFPQCLFSRQFSWALQNSLHFLLVQADVTSLLCLFISRYFSLFLLFKPKLCWNWGKKQWGEVLESLLLFAIKELRIRGTNCIFREEPNQLCIFHCGVCEASGAKTVGVLSLLSSNSEE